MRLSTVILPIYRWARAEALGFGTGYTYDHLSWRSVRDKAWYGAVPTLTAAAGVTGRMRLGTLVTWSSRVHASLPALGKLAAWSANLTRRQARI